MPFLQLICVRGFWPARARPYGCYPFFFNPFGIWFGLNSRYKAAFIPFRMLKMIFV